MKISVEHSKSLREWQRVDAGFFLTPAIHIRNAFKGGAFDVRTLGSYASSVYMPGRLKHFKARSNEKSVTYLRAYDVFEFLPPGAHDISVPRTKKLDDYIVEPGVILQTRSGRNLGPVTMTDEYLSSFALSDDLIRIRISDETEKFYTLAFMKSGAGQVLLRSSNNGSVINHLNVDGVAELPIVFLEEVVDDAAIIMRECVEIRGKARMALKDAVAALNKRYPLPATKLSQGWEVSAALLGSRIDAAAHSDRVREIRKTLLKDGGVLVGQIAEVSKPGGRPKLVYVEKGNGTPYLSGRQILQTSPIGLKYLSAVSIAANSKYALGEGDVIFQADGRAEESLGYPSMALGERVGWLASGHVGRFIPRDIQDAGWLWAATACDVVQEQISTSACGSVVDSVYPEPLESMVLPTVTKEESQRVLEAWKMMAKAEELENRAIRLVDDEMARLGIYGHAI